MHINPFPNPDHPEYRYLISTPKTCAVFVLFVFIGHAIVFYCLYTRSRDGRPVTDDQREGCFRELLHDTAARNTFKAKPVNCWGFMWCLFGGFMSRREMGDPRAMIQHVSRNVPHIEGMDGKLGIGKGGENGSQETIRKELVATEQWEKDRWRHDFGLMNDPGKKHWEHSAHGNLG
ncbi:hypothetical protein E6O75_ATG03771 [Venturia nashicola]|uniref:Uncharacterized protein n=1 Tax=Venturia nashicola TaxID=86259 RepID=A0A4Z1PC11_9PEZI|nr:hypothetical protein E6O75_ATG03771 [Venturia nashicola]